MTQEGAYLNFDLLIHREGPDFIARVTESPTGEASTCFPPPLEAFEAQHLRLLMVRSRGTVRSVDTRSPTIARDIGERLFKAAFKDDVHATYQSSLRLAEQQDKKLRIRLRLTEPEGAQLPWEYLRDPSAGGRFLALDDDTPIVRYMEIPQPARRLHVDGPIRILAVISAPTDRDGLDAEVEWANLQQALAGLVKQGAVTVERLEPPTFANLERELMRTDHHIFHFVGHGGYDPNTQDGVLVFTNEDGTSSPISSDQLGPILGDEKSLQLAVLNACEGAVSEGKDIFAGSAQRLVGTGVPAVVAMQAEITDSAAIAFSERFYEALAMGEAVDDALVRGRKAIFSQPNPLEWGTPVLYMRGDGRLFEVDASRTTAPASAVESPAAPPADPAPVAAATPAAAPAPVAAAAATAPGPVAVGAGAGVAAAFPIAVVPPLSLPARIGDRWKWLLGGFGAALLLLVAIGLMAEQEPAPAEPTSVEAAEAIVWEFFGELAEDDHYDAWLKLSDGMRAQIPFATFDAAHQGLTDVWFDGRGSAVIGPTLVRVNGKYTEVRRDASGSEVQIEYGGSYLVRLIGGSWYLDGAEFQETRRSTP
ncbi:MAG TPA: CHAT domain-containing protein [Candidatus Limnocylindria bacterium]